MPNAPIILLDEPASSIDPSYHDEVNSGIESLPKGFTVIAVTYSFSFADPFDWIFLLEQGHIAESGTHSELLAMNGLYSKLWQTAMA